MGLLDADQERKCFLYLGYLSVNRTGVFVGGQPETTEVVQKLQTSLDNLTANGAISVASLLSTLDALEDKLQGVDNTFSIIQAEDVKFQADEWGKRMVQYNFYRRRLAVQLDVALDPNTEADAAGGGSAMQGPWREP